MKYLLLLLALPCFGQVVTRTVCGPGGPISQNTGISAGEQVNAQSGTSYTYQNTDCGKLVKHSNSMSIAASLPHANATTFRAGWFMDVSNAGVGTVTITPVTSTIDGLATLALLTNEGVRVISNGTNYFTIRGKVTSGGGGGTVTNVGTTAPITGGPITTTGTIACATCVVGPGSATSGHIATFNGTSGVLIQDGGAPATGTVTSIATTSPITGGPVTTTGTIACATCVTSSTPGAGVAHFAGSTQAVTSSAVSLTADVSGTLPNGNTTATSANTASAIVARDGSGNFTAGTITAALTGNASTASAVAVGGITGLGTGVATALAANVSGTGAICLASGSACSGGGGGTIPTTGWTARNGITWNDFLVPSLMAANATDSGALNWRILTQSLGGASTYTFIATVRCLVISGNSSQVYGIYLYDGTKLIGFELLNQAAGAGGILRLRVERMNSVTSDNSTQAGPTGSLVPQTVTLKIVKDATNRTYYYWAAGAYTQFLQEANNAFMTETDVGFGAASIVGSSAVSMALELISWSVGP